MIPLAFDGTELMADTSCKKNNVVINVEFVSSPPNAGCAAEVLTGKHKIVDHFSEQFLGLFVINQG